ncbi:Hsp20/alpha crystallin family protein [Polycladomyces subterraneus]|uniref:Hsp20/alpha crystallin family protein n=1 Tax=Polycladomyces subterraneus TaxID=1016997 RepID=UPI00343FA9FB
MMMPFEPLSFHRLSSFVWRDRREMIREMEKLIEDFPGCGRVVSRVTPTDRGMVIQTRIDVVGKDDVIAVRMEGPFLVIRINSHLVQDADPENQRRIDGQRMFTQSFHIPFPVDESRIQTEWQDQMLTVFVPKRVPDAPSHQSSPHRVTPSDRDRSPAGKQVKKSKNNDNNRWKRTSPWQMW